MYKEHHSLMMKKIRVLLLLAAYTASVHVIPAKSKEIRRASASITRIQNPDGRFHLYVLPIGQGNAQVLQCPSGTITIFDLGSCDGSTAGFWFINELRNFFQGNFHRIKNIVLSHNHVDHYKFFKDVILPTDNLGGLTDIYVSCTVNDLPAVINNWINNIGARNKIREFNHGSRCGSGFSDCRSITLCPGDSGITAKVLSANAGQQCRGGNKNIDSIVIGITYGSFELQLNGDFEDFTMNPNENGPQKAMVQRYGSQLKVTVYSLSHHGAQDLANKPVIRNAVTPKAIIASSNPWYGNKFRHPRCDIIEAFIRDVRSLCKPGETSTASPYYCGKNIFGSIPIEKRVQMNYTCGPENGGKKTVFNNEYAIYTTTPYSDQMNLIHLKTNGSLWGIENNIMRKRVRSAPASFIPTPLEEDECSDE